MADCPFVFFSANVAATSRLAPQLREKQRETGKAEGEAEKIGKTESTTTSPSSQKR